MPYMVSCLTPHEFRGALSGCDKDMTTGKPFMQYNVGDTLGWHFVAEIRTMAACRCLCRDRVVDAKEKRLHGAGCTTAKAVLREVLCVPLEALVETRKVTAVLCYKCE